MRRDRISSGRNAGARSPNCAGAKRGPRIYRDALAPGDLGNQWGDVPLRRRRSRNWRVALSLPADGGRARPDARVVGRLALLAGIGMWARVRRTPGASHRAAAIHDAGLRTIRGRADNSD